MKNEKWIYTQRGRRQPIEFNKPEIHEWMLKHDRYIKNGSRIDKWIYYFIKQWDKLMTYTGNLERWVKFEQKIYRKLLKIKYKYLGIVYAKQYRKIKADMLAGI